MSVSGSRHEREWVHFIVIVSVTHVYEKQKSIRNDNAPMKSNQESLLVMCIKKIIYVDGK